MLIVYFYSLIKNTNYKVIFRNFNTQKTDSKIESVLYFIRLKV